MFYHVILTTKCNLQCRYCFGETLEDMDADFEKFEVDYDLPKRICYDVDSLNRFCIKDPDCVLIFYGGEPLLCVEHIKDIMDSVRARHFLIHTNGLMLNKLESEYVNRLHTILVSIDGDEATTGFHRGRSAFRRVIDNVKLIMQNGFHGELIARMTITEQTDIYKQVRWLMDNDEFSFSSVHWQLNAGFWNDFSRRNFGKWIEESYNPGIGKLARFWVDCMKCRGRVLRLYPFLGVTRSLLLDQKQSRLRCGAGWINYAIQTDGHIAPCPSMWGMKDYYLGHIRNASPLELGMISLSEPCTKCDILSICGGRCLYTNITRRWNAEAYDLVCETVRNLVGSIKREIPRMRRLIHEETIQLEDFQFMKFNGCEIIP